MIRNFGWALKRELWENRWLWLAPSAISAALLVGAVVYAIRLPGSMPSMHALDAVRQRHAIGTPYDLVAGLMMGVGLILAAIYCVDALYGERRDRSIMLWKSLPVSDVMTVLAKLCVPILVLPVIVWALTVVVQAVMLLASSAVLAAHGESAALLWSQVHIVSMSLGLLYHLVVMHGVSLAPLYAWLLLVSAWATRAPFAWAILPPAAIIFLERMTFGTTHFVELVFAPLSSGAAPNAPTPAGATMMDTMNGVPLTRLLAMPALWAGLAVAALFLAGAVRLRRSAQPV